MDLVDEWCLVQFNVFMQYGVQGEEDWDCDQYWQVVGDWVDFFFFVQFYYCLLYFLFVVVVMFFECIYLWFEFVYVCGRDVLCFVEFVDGYVDQQYQQDDCEVLVV